MSDWTERPNSNAANSAALPFGARVHTPAPLTPVASRSTALPLPGRDRATWRLAAICLILRSCRGRSTTIEQLHVLMWALRDEANAAIVRELWDDSRAHRALRAFDPLLDDTLALARASGLIQQRPNGRHVLSEVGGRLADSIRDTEGLMEEEQRLLAHLGGNITERGMWQRLGSPGQALRERSSLR
jgi:hypothetical protein